MKANEAPEKLYLIQHNGLVCYCRNNKDDIEFIRTDAFIEKACKKLKKCMYDNLMFQGRLHRDEVIETFVEGFTMYTEKKEYTEINRENNGVKTQSEPRDRYKAMIEGFASYVRGDSENPWNYDYELGLYKLILKGCGVKL